MEYSIEEVKHPVGAHSSWSEWFVLDSNNTKVTQERLLCLEDAEFLVRKLKMQKPEVASDEPDMAFFEKLYGNDPSNEKLIAANQPVVEQPVPANVNQIAVSGQLGAVGQLVAYRGDTWLVTQVFNMSASDVASAEDGFDVFLSPGWHTSLVRLDLQVMTCVSEQVLAGKAVLTGPYTVKFEDEEEAQDLHDLRYSSVLGLHDSPIANRTMSEEKRHGGPRRGAGRPPKGTPTKLSPQEQLVVYAKQIALYRGYTDLVDGLQPVSRLREKYLAEIEEFKEALAHKTWLHALHESSDVLYYAACIDASSGSTLYLDALRECAQLLRFHSVRVSSAQIEAAAIAKYAWRAAGKDHKNEAHELTLIEQAVSK